MGGRLKWVICLSAIAGCAVAAAPAGASTLIGPPIVATNNAPTLCPSQCGLMDTVIGPGTATLTAPFDGVLTAWHVVTQSAGASPTAQLRVVRLSPLVSDPSSFAIELRASGSTITPGPTFQEESAQTRTPIAAGDMLAVAASNAAIGGYLNNPGRGGFFTPGPDGYTSTFNNPAVANYYLLDADLEPDADHDGYGDETQDQCPTDPSTQGPCPSPSPAVSAPTGQRAAALKKCKHKHGKARKRCKRRAKKLPL